MLFEDVMYSGRSFHSVAEEVSNKHLLYLIGVFLLCTSGVVEADLNGLITFGG